MEKKGNLLRKGSLGGVNVEFLCKLPTSQSLCTSAFEASEGELGAVSHFRAYREILNFRTSNKHAENALSFVLIVTAYCVKQ